MAFKGKQVSPIINRMQKLTCMCKPKVPTTVTPWPKNKPLRASVNNFGYGGTNAHVILEAAPKDSQAARRNKAKSTRINNGTNGTHDAQNGNGVNHTNGIIGTNGTNGINGANGTNGDIASGNKEDRSLVYVVSAKDSVASQGMNKSIAAYIRESIANKTGPSPVDLAFTLAERRSLFTWVTAIRATDLEELADRLDEPERKALRATKRPRLGFVFNGQGAQWHAMGRELIGTYPVFDSSLLEADRILKDYGATWSLHGKLPLLNVSGICMEYGSDD